MFCDCCSQARYERVARLSDAIPEHIQLRRLISDLIGIHVRWVEVVGTLDRLLKRIALTGRDIFVRSDFAVVFEGRRESIQAGRTGSGSWLDYPGSSVALVTEGLAGNDEAFRDGFPFTENSGAGLCKNDDPGNHKQHASYRDNQFFHDGPFEGFGEVWAAAQTRVRKL